MMPQDRPVQMIGLDEIVARLDTTERHVRRIARDGRLKVFKIGNKIKTTEAELQAYIESAQKPVGTYAAQPPRPRTSVTQNIGRAAS